MGRFWFGTGVRGILALALLCLLPACGGHKAAPASSPYPIRVSLNPTPSTSLQVGMTLQFVATAQNSANQSLTAAFTYTVTPLGQGSGGTAIVDVTPLGTLCAGTWNAPLYSVCTPGNFGVAEVTASALGATSAPTLVFVHPPIDNIKISVVPSLNPPPACPGQQQLPAACTLPFNAKASNFCLSQNQVETLQATAYSQGSDITALVGPFTFTPSSVSVVKVSPTITNNSYNVPTNQATFSPVTPGATQITASASGVFSEPFVFEACPVQCIALQRTENGSILTGSTFIASKGTAETITATAVDVQGCIVPQPSLTWTSSNPAAISAPSTCSTTATCNLTTVQPGAASISASCTPPNCNAGFPLNLGGFAAPYIPQPVYPVTSISGLVTGATSSTTVLATSQDCFSNILCEVGMYNVSTSTNQPGGASQSPTPPNSLLFDVAGDRAYMGSQFGALVINPGNVGSGTAAFSQLLAPGTPLGLVTGKVLAVSRSGNLSIFSDTVSTPNQVYVVNAAPASTVALNINSATTAAFSPDGLKAFILGDGGTNLYVYSPQQALSPAIPLPSAATAIAFNSTGTFALLSGGSAASTLAAYNTCDNSAVSLAAGAVATPPLFLQNVPAGLVPLGSTFGNIVIPATLEASGLDFFFGLDDTGIDIIATNSTQDATFATLCPQAVTVAQTVPPANTPFPPVHINIGQGTFNPLAFFLSPDLTRAYVVTRDRGVLVYNFDTNSTSGIALVNNATPVAADMTVDGSLLYVSGSDGLLHQLNTSLMLDENQTTFGDLPNSPNSYCYTGENCLLNLIAVKP